MPDDFSGTYIVNVETNTTQVLAAPTSKDIAATYFGGIKSLIQLSSDGAVSFLPYNQFDAGANSAATWSAVKPIAVSCPPGSSRLSPSVVSQQGGYPTPSSSSSGTKSNANGTSTQASGATQGSHMASGLVVAFCLAAMASLL